MDLRGEQDTHGLGKKGAPAYGFSTAAGRDTVSQDGLLQPTGGDSFSAQPAQAATRREHRLVSELWNWGLDWTFSHCISYQINSHSVTWGLARNACSWAHPRYTCMRAHTGTHASGHTIRVHTQAHIHAHTRTHVPHTFLPKLCGQLRCFREYQRLINKQVLWLPGHQLM